MTYLIAARLITIIIELYADLITSFIKPPLNIPRYLFSIRTFLPTALAPFYRESARFFHSIRTPTVYAQVGPHVASSF